MSRTRTVEVCSAITKLDSFAPYFVQSRTLGPRPKPRLPSGGALIHSLRAASASGVRMVGLVPLWIRWHRAPRHALVLAFDQRPNPARREQQDLRNHFKSYPQDNSHRRQQATPARKCNSSTIIPRYGYLVFDPQFVAPSRCGGHVAVHGRDKYLTSLACGGVALGSQ
jgi:hypothetical protein